MMDKVAPLVLPVPVPPERELSAWQVYRRMLRIPTKAATYSNRIAATIPI